MKGQTLDKVNGCLREWDPISGTMVKVRGVAAAKAVGRPLRADEVVHHVNGNKTDDRPENLRVMSSSERSALHVANMPRKVKSCWDEDGEYRPTVPEGKRSERDRSRARENYLKNRKARLDCQRKYDSAHKEAKRRYDKARRERVKQRLSAETQPEVPLGRAE